MSAQRLAGRAGVDLLQARSIETHCVEAWPPAVVRHTDDGWILRATPGLPGRGRSNHALPPTRRLKPAEYDRVVDRVVAFADEHGSDAGIQVSPMDLHATFSDALVERGWRLGNPVKVMIVDTRSVPVPDERFELTVSDHASDEWVKAWARCDSRPDIDDHVRHVFPRMAGRAHFARAGDSAVGISVERDGLVGLFCLAVDPARRRQGIGKALVGAMLARYTAPLTYLQVFTGNDAGIALYRSLGFREAYWYLHATAPAGR
ncbi:MAG: GNAT family N-acetyltransferase [Solirubrobacteraceae bacterium]